MNEPDEQDRREAEQDQEWQQWITEDLEAYVKWLETFNREDE